MKNIILISNDEIKFSDKSVSSNFNDTLNIISALKKKFRIFLISRETTQKQSFKTNSNKIFKLSFSNYKKFNIKNPRVFMVSVTPRNLLNFFYLSFLLRKKLKGFVYLRSDGFKEYNIKFGIIGYFFYFLLLNLIKSKLKIISVKSKLTKIHTRRQLIPSEISGNWFRKRKFKFNKKKIKILYFGRFKKEKGFFSLIQLIRKMKTEYNFTFAGDEIHKDIKLKNLSIIGRISSEKKIISLYDNNDIFVLPSYTEGCPKVVHESISRIRPIIIFDDIFHVKNTYKGIFCCERNVFDFQKKIKYISTNYKNIQKKMLKNKINTKKDFQKNILNLIK